MTDHQSIGERRKPALGWSRYRDANPVPTSPLADEITTAPSGPVISLLYIYNASWKQLRSCLKHPSSLSCGNVCFYDLKYSQFKESRCTYACLHCGQFLFISYHVYKYTHAYYTRATQFGGLQYLGVTSNNKFR